MPTTTTSAPGSTDGHTAHADHHARTDAGLAATAAEESSRILHRLRDKKDAVFESLQPRIEAVSTFARNDPTKAVLISAATGAALMALIGLIIRSSNRPSSRARNAMATIRDAALDLADRAHSAATSAITTTHQRASDAQTHAEAVQKRVEQRIAQAQKRAAELHQRASDAATSATDAATDTWQSLREQAAPVIERLRPQIDAVASYAKEDPVRAALGAAAAGAVLLGLITLIRRSGS